MIWWNPLTKLMAGTVFLVLVTTGSFFYGEYHQKSKDAVATYQSAYTQLHQQEIVAPQIDAKFNLSLNAFSDQQTTLIKKVPVYVKDNRACDLNSDAIGLLNSSRAVSVQPAQ